MYKNKITLIFLFCCIFILSGINTSTTNLVFAQEEDDLSDEDLEKELEDLDREEAKQAPPSKSKEGEEKEFEGETTEKKYRPIETDLSFEPKSLFKAGALSLLIGFGTGNFYAENAWPGYVSLVVEMIGGALLIAALASGGIDLSGMSTGAVMLMAGLGLFGGGRLFDTISAVYSAHKYNKSHESTFSLNPSPSLYFCNNRPFIGLDYRF